MSELSCGPASAGASVLARRSAYLPARMLDAAPNVASFPNSRLGTHLREAPVSSMAADDVCGADSNQEFRGPAFLNRSLGRSQGLSGSWKRKRQDANVRPKRTHFS